MIRAVVDVNVLVSTIIGPLGLSRQVVLAWEAGAFAAITADGIIREVEEKLRLPRIARRYHIAQGDVRWMFDLLQTHAEMVTVAPEECLAVTGDPEDDYVLATGRLARAEYLVTGDRGLLELGHYAGMAIVTPRTFLEILHWER
jgi:putative PIN family toxin of toxin-antitoxin system